VSAEGYNSKTSTAVTVKTLTAAAASIYSENSSVRAIAYGNGMFVAVGISSGKMAYLSDK